MRWRFGPSSNRDAGSKCYSRSSSSRGGLVYSIETVFERRWVTRAAAAAMLVLIASCTPSSATRDDPRLARLLEDRQAIWQAWFTNDRSRLEQLLPNGLSLRSAAPRARPA